LSKIEDLRNNLKNPGGKDQEGIYHYDRIFGLIRTQPKLRNLQSFATAEEIKFIEKVQPEEGDQN
jgi:hypothetical protein